MEPSPILAGMVIGIGASLLVDLWNLLVRHVFGIPSLDYRLLGRWILHMPAGTFRHASIGRAPEKRFERPVGWFAHFSIGAGLAIAFAVLAPRDWMAHPTFLPALLYGVGTVVFPMFVMQPAFGLGPAASRTPKPLQARVKSLLTHTVYGVGLYACARGLGYVLRIEL